MMHYSHASKMFIVQFEKDDEKMYNSPSLR